FLAFVGGVQEREAVGQQQSGADALHGARGEQQGQARRQRAQQGRSSEQPSAGDQQAAAAVMVAQGAAEEEQRRQGQQEGVDHPLDLGGAGAVTGADRGQGDVEHRAVDERQARGEDTRRQGPARVGSRFLPGAGAHSALAIDASTMRCQASASPAAAAAWSGSRMTWSTASASGICSRHVLSTSSPAEGSMPFALLLSASPARTRAMRSTSDMWANSTMAPPVAA